MRARAPRVAATARPAPVATASIMAKKDYGNKRTKDQAPADKTAEKSAKEERPKRKGRRGKADDDEEWSEDDDATRDRNESAEDVAQAARSKRSDGRDLEEARKQSCFFDTAREGGIRRKSSLFSSKFRWNFAGIAGHPDNSI